MAIEIVDFPSKDMMIFHRYVAVYQRVVVSNIWPGSVNDQGTNTELLTILCRASSENPKAQG